MKHPKSFETDSSTSSRMAKVKLKHGVEETLLAKSLWSRGYRYRLNYKKLPGSPDIAISRLKVAIFVDGEFWHGYDWKNKKTKLKRNRDYWIEKIEENIARDKRVDNELAEMGWKVIRFWSKSIIKDVDGCIQKIEELIDNHSEQ